MFKRIEKFKKKYLAPSPRQKYVYARYLQKYPVNPKAILFESFHGQGVSDSALHLLQEMMRTGEADQYTIYFSTKDEKMHQPIVDNLGLPVKLVNIMSDEYLMALATCKYLMNNSSFPTFFVRRPEQHYLQTWHGTPVKTLGKRMRLGIESMHNVQHNFLQADRLLFPNDFTRDMIMRDYNLFDLYTGHVGMIGYPRNDVFFTPQDKVRALRQRYGIDDCTCIAYMPTWRGTSNHDLDVNTFERRIRVVFDELDRRMGPKQKLFVNFHSMVIGKIDLSGYEHIQAFPADADHYEFLNAMDCLATDYSSVYIDYSITLKPIVLFMFDLDEYLHDRGVYLDGREMPFITVYENEEFIDCLVNETFRDCHYDGSTYAESYLKYERPDNSRVALDFWFGRPMPEDVQIMDFTKNAERPWNLLDPADQGTVEDVEAMCQAADPEKDIVVFSRYGFSMDMSAQLHDFHRDDFNFVFLSRIAPRTYWEEFTRKRSKKSRKAIAARAQQQNFPNLNIVSTTKDVHAAQTGLRYSVRRMKGMGAKATSDGATVRIELDTTAYQPQRLCLASDRLIRWSRDLTAEEQQTGVVVDDLCAGAALPEALIGWRLAVLIAATDRKSGKQVLLRVSCPKPSVSEDDSSALRLAPITVADDVLPQGDGAVSALLRRRNGKTVVAVPCLNRKNGSLAIMYTYQGNDLRSFKHAQLESATSTPEGGLSARLKVRGKAQDVLGVRLVLRGSVDDRSVELPFSCQQEGSTVLVSTEANARDLDLVEIYWDAFVVLRDGEGEGLVPIQCGKEHRRYLKLHVVQSLTGDGYTLFPQVADHNKCLSFTYRPVSPYDTLAIRNREMAALAVFKLLKPYWRRKRIWLVYEKFCNNAQDNGYQFFRYCMEDVPASKNKHVYYIIKPDSPDYGNVAKYGKQVIEFMSFKHMLYALAATVFVASDSRAHAYAWRPMPSLIKDRIMKKRILFLQHGVTACKHVHPIFGKKGSNPMTYFLTTSKKEQDVVVKHFGYSRLQAPILGFSRWDVLKSTATADHPVIMLMPTWRPWLEEQSDDVFAASDYFRTYRNLITSPELVKLLDENDATLKFHIHPKLSKHIRAFAGDDLSPRIQLIEQGSVPMNQLLMECNLLITDYSSVCWEALFQNKPVVYYHFDQRQYLNAVGSYIDFDTELPGTVCADQDAVIQALRDYAASGFALSAQDQAKADGWFKFKDTDNRKRTYEFLEGRGF
ncbi:MAG: CDP-glycerol glycerophosphotransferase family protein [Coriobacteriia bacterium]|nr:CDP-glycerol glycerophosphotransferase family protein [Coriobacteriia bacterium]